MPRPRGLSPVVLVLLVLVAFTLGIVAERWLNGERREEALRRYEQAVRDYGPVDPPARPATGSVQD